MGTQCPCPRVIVSRQATSTVKRGIRPHSTAFSLSPFDGTGPLSHTSLRRWRVRRWAAPAGRKPRRAANDGGCSELWVKIN
jgi:hypothetical protein